MIGLILTPRRSVARDTRDHNRQALHNSVNEVCFRDGSVTFRDSTGLHASFALSNKDGEQLYSLLRQTQKHSVHMYEKQSGLQINLIGMELAGQTHQLPPL